MPEATSLVPGWYGKIPSLGDFASRRLPSHFVSAWDNWLQHAVAASRADLGQRWLDVYLLSPIWRFALLPGVIGSTAWAGVLMPSVDKVGRHFPLTLAVSLDEQPGIMAAVLAAQGWYEALEKVALSTLDIGFSPEQLEADLAKLSFPLPEALPLEDATNKLAALFQNASPACSIALPALDVLPSVWNNAAYELLLKSAYGKSLWWTSTGNNVEATLCGFIGLPPEERFASLLEGRLLPEEIC